MKQVKVTIKAEVTGYVTVSENTTNEQIKNGIVDIYFCSERDGLSLQKEDLGADFWTVTLPDEDE